MRDYDEVTAQHYAAYRPPLHAGILAQAFRQGEYFAQALDVGCGTGHSSHALRAWCGAVIGMDNSPAMIARAQPAVNIRFHWQSGTNLSVNLRGEKFELVTFAGSLFYLNAEEVIEDLQQLLLPGGTVLVYDFEVQLQPVFSRLGVSLPEEDYDHGRNLSSILPAFLFEEQKLQSTVNFEAYGKELAHLLSSVRSWREGQLAGYSLAELERALSGKNTLSAKTWFTRYAG